MISRRMKIFFLTCLIGATVITLIGGMHGFKDIPPYPGKIVDETGNLLADKETILRGQAVFQKYGLMDLGSVWGHGTYRGTEFTASTLHQMGKEIRDFHASRQGISYAEMDGQAKAAIDSLAIKEIKENRYDAAADTLTLSASQAHALKAIQAHYDHVFSNGEPEANIQPNTIKDAADRKDLATFFYWTAWASGTLRPGDIHTYTNNWPPDTTVGNVPSSSALIWTVVSIIAFMAFLAAIAVIFHWWGFYGKEERDHAVAHTLAESTVTPSQVKAAKYFVVVVTLFLLQTAFGGLMAHYTVHPSDFFGIKAISSFIPYTWAKTWHVQLPIFWIAVSWIGATIYLAPLISRREPKYQGILVDILFGAALFVALGSLVGEVIGIKGLAGKNWFWVGHQGWEYLELGRLWQILLFAGLGLWLFIVARALAPHFKKGKDFWGLPHFLVYSTAAVVGFFSFGLMYNPRTHLTIADFWRWWVVHTWVEGMFEFFAVAAIGVATVALGLARPKDALRTAYLTAGLALATGIIGVGHHYYWFGNPSLWFALGGVLSAMEPVPVVLLLGKAWQEYRSIRQAGVDFPYKWPLMYIVSSAVWAFIGAGLFGFLITTPIVNYYEHSTYLTVHHGHAALFGVYGMLAIGLMLFSLRGMVRRSGWSEKLVGLSWYGTNIGLALMTMGTLLPVGLKQLKDSFENGLWHARSPEFYADPFVNFIGTVRAIPDMIIILFGVVPLVLAVVVAVANLKRAVTVPERKRVEIPLTDEEDLAEELSHIK